MRKSFFVACLLAVCSFSFASSALAIEGMYVSGNIGAEMLRDSVTKSSYGEVKFDTGYAFTVAVGRKIEYVRIEGEYNYRASGIKKAGSDSAKGDIKSFGFTLNALFDIDTNTPFTPFIGGGVGVATVDVEIVTDTLPKESDDDTTFAYQAIAGVSYSINENSSIDLSYRYYATTDPDFDGIKGEYGGHNFMLGVRYSF